MGQRHKQVTHKHKQMTRKVSNSLGDQNADEIMRHNVYVLMCTCLPIKLEVTTYIPSNQ